jgi:hypothetical protein
MVVVSSVLVGTIDVDRKLVGPTVTVEFSCEVVLNDSTPALYGFLLYFLSPANDRYDVGLVVRLKERETFAVAEFSVEETEELGEDTAGDVAVF